MLRICRVLYLLLYVNPDTCARRLLGNSDSSGLDLELLSARAYNYAVPKASLAAEARCLQDGTCAQRFLLGQPDSVVATGSGTATFATEPGAAALAAVQLGGLPAACVVVEAPSQPVHAAPQQPASSGFRVQVRSAPQCEHQL